MQMVLSQEFDCQSRESAGRFAEVEVRAVVVFTGVGKIENIDTGAIRAHICDGLKQFVKFKAKEDKPPCGNLGVPMRHG